MLLRFTALIPAITLFTLLALPASVSRADDLVRQETGVDAAAANFNTTGKNVIVAIMDRGIDWKNADFRNADGTTRIKYIFDLTDDTGAGDPGNPYGKGTIYTESQINTALSAGTALATRDAVGHGTTTAGLAAGNGRNRSDRRYHGMAPDATLIIVKITSDGAPAHDGQPAEAPFYDPARIPIAIDFIKAKAAELGMPCVMLLNLGSQAGPTDGTSDLCQKIDATVGPGKPGLAFVTGAGDDGGMPNRAGGTAPSGGNAAIQITKGLAGSLYLDLWYPGTDRFDVSITTPNGVYGPFPSPATNNDSDVQSTADFLYYQLGSSVHFYGSSNSKREIWVRLDGPTGNYTINLFGASVSSGRFDATLNPSQMWSSASVNKFTSFVAPGSIWDGATAHYNIAPNSCVIRTSWVDIDNIMRTFTGQGTVGQLWFGSSVGPTFDGRLGVDVSSPGDRTIATYCPTSYWATFRFNEIQGESGHYGMAGAVSAAAPITTGIVALMLQRNPSLDAAQIKSLLQQTAKSDSFTGATPNANWGYGKINAALAVQKTTALGLLTLSPSAVMGGSGVSGTVNLNSAAPPGGTTVNLSNTSPAAHLSTNSVIVPSGSTSAPFSLTTDAVSSDQAGVVTATLGSAQSTAALTVTTVAVSALSLSPTTVIGGNSSTATITLAAPAPAGGLTVSLSSDKAQATVPASISIAPGQTGGQFTVTTSAIAAAVTAAISAQAGGPAKSASLSIQPLQVSTLAVAPSSLAGGNSATGTVTLNGPAPPGGASVTLSSNKSQASVPGSVTVAEGQTSVIFTVTTTPVTAQVSATLTATLGVKKSKTLTIKPPAVLSLAFSPTAVYGGVSSTGTVTLSGPAPGGGVSATLSSDQSCAAVPASVVAAAGQTTATFTVTTSVVYANTVADITATAGGLSKTAKLTVKQHLVKSVSLTPTSVKGGVSSTGKVTLKSVAGPGGVVVTLGSDNAKATVPASVTVPAGQTSATFTVSTGSVTAQTTASISAAINTSRAAAILTITP